MSVIVKIHSQVPFGQFLYGWFYVRNLHVNEVVEHDDMEVRYLAWETVRKTMNPYFHTGTGFEGYLIGRCSEPEAALETILAINQHILDSIALIYRYEYNFHSRLMKTLMREITDRQAIHIWSGCLGAELGRLRVHVVCNQEATLFQRRTYSIINALPRMVYHEGENNITQTYAIAADHIGPEMNKIAITQSMLKPCQQDAWLVAENIGEFGHPLVRRFLDR